MGLLLTGSRRGYPSGALFIHKMAGASGQTVPDSSGNGNPLQLGATTGAEGSDAAINASPPRLTGDGAATYARVAVTSRTVAAFTMWCVTRLSAAATAASTMRAMMIERVASATPLAQIGKQTNNTTVTGAVRTDGSVLTTNTGVLTLASTWHLLTLVWDGTNLTLYDGTTVVQQQALAAGTLTFDVVTLLASSRAAATFFWNGDIANDGFYPRALPDNQRLRLYRQIQKEMAAVGITI